LIDGGGEDLVEQLEAADGVVVEVLDGDRRHGWVLGFAAALGGLERVGVGDAGEAAAGAGRLLGAADEEVAAVGAGDGAADGEQVLVGIHRDDLEVAHGDRASPMWPAARMPLSMREGKALAPMEPGARWNMEPWVAAPPPKWWRLTKPAKPRPLLTPSMSRKSRSLNISASTWSPTLAPSPSACLASGTSRSRRQGGRLAASKRWRSGLERRPGLVNSMRPSWAAS